MAELTQILQAVERGEENSSERLLPLVYDELRRLATIRMSRERRGFGSQPRRRRSGRIADIFLRLPPRPCAAY